MPITGMLSRLIHPPLGLSGRTPVTGSAGRAVRGEDTGSRDVEWRRGWLTIGEDGWLEGYSDVYLGDGGDNGPVLEDAYG